MPEHTRHRTIPKETVLQFQPFEGLPLERIRLPQSGAERAEARSALLDAPFLGFDTEVKPKFKEGDMVVVKNMHPVGHTRLPRYVRDKLGCIDRDHGVFVFPDAAAHGKAEKPQHYYSVYFSAQELWGSRASRNDSVFVDLWDDYLVPA